MVIELSDFYKIFHWTNAILANESMNTPKENTLGGKRYQEKESFV